MADPRQHVGLGVRRAVGRPPRLLQFMLALLALRKIAKHREEIRTVGPGASHRDRQRNDAAPGYAAQHVAAVIEQARDLGALDASQIIQHGDLTLRREQLGQIALHEVGAIITEQRLGAAVARMDVALGVEHHDAFGRGVEDGAKFLGIGLADGGRFWRSDRISHRRSDINACRSRVGKNQRQRGIIVP